MPTNKTHLHAQRQLLSHTHRYRHPVHMGILPAQPRASPANHHRRNRAHGSASQPVSKTTGHRRCTGVPRQSSPRAAEQERHQIPTHHTLHAPGKRTCRENQQNPHGKSASYACSALYSRTGQLSHPARNHAHRSHVYHGYTWAPLSTYRTSPVDTCNPVAACKGL